MSFYGDRIPHYVDGKNEEELRKKLLVIAHELNQKLEIVNVYHNASKNRTIAWYFHDIKAAPLPRAEASSTVKKVRKKAVKKA